METVNTNELLSKGVPVELPLSIIINYGEIVEVCKHTPNIKEQLDEAINVYLNNINEVCGEKVRDFRFKNDTMKFTIYTNPDTLETSLMLPYINLEVIVMMCLGAHHKIDKPGTNAYNAFHESIDRLKQITTEEELKSEFPGLHEKYTVEKELEAFYFNMKSKLKKIPTTQRNYYMEKLVRVTQEEVDRETFMKAILTAQPTYDLSNFLENAIQCLEQIYAHAFGSIEYPIFSLDIAEEDKNRFELLIASLYTDTLKLVPKSDYQNYIYYLSAYFFDNQAAIKSNFKMLLNSQDKIVRIRDLYSEFEETMRNNPELKLVDFKAKDFTGMNIKEVQEFMNEYFKDISADWDFFKDTTLDEETLRKIKGYYKNASSPEVQKQMQDAISKFLEKKKLFDQTDPYYRIRGKKTFNGYIGYIYKNGTVVLEKFFENYETGRVATNQAIYIMTTQEFYNLTHLSKNELISQKLCKRFIHKGDWQSKILEEINKDTNFSPVADIENLKKSGTVTTQYN